jgi:hypothetical protein
MTPPPILQRDTNTVTIATFWENYLLGKYNFDPPYQRQSVWNDEKQSFFIDSILKNFPIPPIFLHQHIDEASGKTTYDVIDGKQRLLALIRFIKNEIPISNEREQGDAFYDSKSAGATFEELNRPELVTYKKQFWRYAIPIEYIDTTSADIIDDIFDRLNRNGEPLTGQELRNAKYHGRPFLELVQRLTVVPFWAARLKNVDVSRMEDQEFISELLFVVLERGPLRPCRRLSIACTKDIRSRIATGVRLRNDFSILRASWKNSISHTRPTASGESAIFTNSGVSRGIVAAKISNRIPFQSG